MTRAGLVLMVACVMSVCAGAQTVAGDSAKDSAHTAFESASVRPAPANRTTFSYNNPSGARMTETGMLLDQLIQIAFGLERRDLEAPDWTKTARYDIEARTEGGISLTREEMQPLMQRLLVDRFGLKYHFETREVAGYALVVAKGGPKLQLSKVQKMGPGSILRDGLQFPSSTMKQLAAVLVYPLGQKPVVDKTGLTEFYTINMKYAAEGDTESTLPSIFTALQEQLGLKLEPEKVTVKVLVVDHVEKTPTEN